MNGKFMPLLNFHSRIPAIKGEILHGVYEDNNWWVKFQIELKHELAWNVVQELGHVINYISTEERLPLLFYPVSAPPYLNGGPDNFLYWIVGSTQPDFLPEDLQKWLQSRLPDPVENMEEWQSED
jgi:hypothetical protein